MVDHVLELSTIADEPETEGMNILLTLATASPLAKILVWNLTCPLGKRTVASLAVMVTRSLVGALRFRSLTALGFAKYCSPIGKMDKPRKQKETLTSQ